MKPILLVLAPILLICAGCAATGSGSSSIDGDLSTIRSGYNQCVSNLGADSPQCQQLANGVHQIADSIGNAQTTAGRVNMQNQLKQSMGY